MAGRIFYVTNSGEGSKNSLFHNERNGTFRDVASEVGLADLNQASTGVSMGGVWGDYDNDGYEDLFLYKWGKPELFHNDAGKTFTPSYGSSEIAVVGKCQHRDLV
jgi:hypothetical protein